MAVTLTASLATSAVQPINVHAGVNAVSGSFNAGANVLSLSGSGVVLLCKVPANATIIGLMEYHTTGAATGVLNIGVRNGASASTSFSALAADLAQATSNVVFNQHLPYQCSFDSASGERFKYITASKVSGTVTTSVKVNFTVFYTTGTDSAT